VDATRQLRTQLAGLVSSSVILPKIYWARTHRATTHSAHKLLQYFIILNSHLRQGGTRGIPSSSASIFLALEDLSLFLDPFDFFQHYLQLLLSFSRLTTACLLGGWDSPVDFRSSGVLVNGQPPSEEIRSSHHYLCALSVCLSSFSRDRDDGVRSRWVNMPLLNLFIIHATQK
jgi:hypothetical protein